MQSAVLTDTRRDVRVMSVVGVCHFFSHFYQLALPPLFVLMHQTEGYSFESLALLITVLYATSFCFQIPVGFFVDRFGARTILMAGVAVLSGTTMLYGILPGYASLVGLAVVAGAANSVFHPADYSILNASISKPRLGRAFSVHNFGGFLGYALAPVLVSGMGELWGWRTAIVIAGSFGLITVFAAILLSRDFRDSSHTRRETETKSDLKADLRLLFSAPALLCVMFFAFLAGGQMGPQFFTDKVYYVMHQIPVVLGNSFITVYVFGIAGGILAGGYVADKVASHMRLAFWTFLLSGVFTFGMAIAPPEAGILYAVFAVAGFFFGFGFSSRDLVVSSLAPPESSGKVFGFVFSGLDIGAASVPIVFGYMLGAGLEAWVFYVASVLLVGAGISVYAAGTSAFKRS
jgi:FSR family fosmidomycin resistance protein-like MFS transporter